MTIASQPWKHDFGGRLDELVIESSVLKNNPLGDPHVRPLYVYVPKSYEEQPSKRFPTVYVIQGYTGQVDMWKNRPGFRPNYIELIDQASLDCIVVFIDAWTSVGGSQFVDSPATGKYHTYICDEVVPFVDGKYRTLASREHRGIQGKSSGGNGAAITAMLRPDLFGGFASHSGGGLFEVTIRPFFRESVRTLRDLYDGSIDRWLADFHSRPAFSRPNDIHILLQYGFSACYSIDGSITLPYDTSCGTIIEERWNGWLRWDYPELVPKHAEALRSMKAIYIDCGKRDEWFLDLTAEWLRRELTALSVKDLFVELFDATHMEIEYRYPLSLKYLVERLS